MKDVRVGAMFICIQDSEPELRFHFFVPKPVHQVRHEEIHTRRTETGAPLSKACASGLEGGKHFETHNAEGFAVTRHMTRHSLANAKHVTCISILGPCTHETAP